MGGVTVVATAQHRELADDVFDLFGIVPDIDLDLMHHDQTLSTLAARAMAGIDDMISGFDPIWSRRRAIPRRSWRSRARCFYRKVPFLHVEAGLRSFNLDNPSQRNSTASSRAAARACTLRRRGRPASIF